VAAGVWWPGVLLQVSHHPPVGAAHAENSAWTYDIVSAPTTRFLGNSLEVFPRGEGQRGWRGGVLHCPLGLLLYAS
jgi:hypothetical protein